MTVELELVCARAGIKVITSAPAAAKYRARETIAIATISGLVNRQTAVGAPHIGGSCQRGFRIDHESSDQSGQTAHDTQRLQPTVRPRGSDKNHGKSLCDRRRGRQGLRARAQTAVLQGACHRMVSEHKKATYTNQAGRLTFELASFGDGRRSSLPILGRGL